MLEALHSITGADVRFPAAASDFHAQLPGRPHLLLALHQHLLCWAGLHVVMFYWLAMLSVGQANLLRADRIRKLPFINIPEIKVSLLKVGTNKILVSKEPEKMPERKGPKKSFIEGLRLAASLLHLHLHLLHLHLHLLHLHLYYIISDCCQGEY